MIISFTNEPPKVAVRCNEFPSLLKHGSTFIGLYKHLLDNLKTRKNQTMKEGNKTVSRSHICDI